jgi:hypothetical protein
MAEKNRRKKYASKEHPPWGEEPHTYHSLNNALNISAVNLRKIIEI